ncbi:hypothetical protein SAMN05421812_105135 [Asanoa hainanensis]|uniref:Uncharacterized protein n=1 Tax=Asanoa hainanensis TaxID=560556 RepID=A0A239M4F2_9ACTN|nr:hypothetical protein [Asanoa hainanensis]SNT37707.1 hypothetical protein SAMN05421812_105135 [Asanoa hainanensis]
MSDDLQEFARQLMRAVRDEAIQSCDNALTTGPRTAVGRRWFDATDAAGRDAIRMAIPDIVDEVIFHFLNRGIDQGALPLSLRTSDGSVVDLAALDDDGLGGWFMTDWRQRYSDERFSDDFSE